MISWRCPRPIAVIESMALIPVSIGSVTGWRSTTDGACTSSGRLVSASIGPKPSIGFARGSTTRPRKASPTGTESTSPVRRTACPSSILDASPRSTQPISRISRLSAMPSSPPSNSSSSLVIAEWSPSTRAIPSPVSRTRPTSSRAVAGEYAATFRSIASRISSGRIVSSVMGSCSLYQAAVRRFNCGSCRIRCFQLWWFGPKFSVFLTKNCSVGLFKTRGNCSIYYFVTDHNVNPTEDLRV